MFIIKQNDTSPVIQAKLRTSQNRPVNLIGATIAFHMKHENGTLKVNNPANIVDDEEGIVKYEWQTGDTSKEGVYYAEFQVTYEDESVETFPNNGYIKIRIVKELA
jgi:uncharacterized protein YfaS (alpha-2-macroglobulin family)